jgi:ABC-2 type transport system ATP-binding protein
MAAITVSGLRKAYRGADAARGDAVRGDAVRGVDFEVPAGQIFALLGPNGAGKTTTVEILEGFRQRDAGQVSVLGADPGRHAGRHAARHAGRLRERIGIVLQDGAFDHFLTVAEELALQRRYYPRPRPAAELLAIAGLADKAKTRIRDLSGGQRRRLDLALALAGNPELIFLDEPTTGFDPAARRGAWELIRGLAAQGITVLLTTHYMDEAQALADWVAVMNDGQIVAAGPPGALGGVGTTNTRTTTEPATSAAIFGAGQATVVRFRLPASAGVAGPPPIAGLARVPGEAGTWELRTSQPTADLHTLTGWALDHGTELEALTVSRPTLEDVYLRLTASSEAPS